MKLKTDNLMKSTYKIVLLILVFSTSIIKAQFSNYSKSYNWNLLTTYSNGGGGGVTLSITNNVLSLSFSAGFTETTLKQGKIAPTDYAGTLPNTEIPIPAGNFFAGKGYRFFIVDNQLAIYHTSPVSLTGFSGTISVNLTTPVSIPTDISTYLSNWTSQNKVMSVSYLTDLGDSGKKKTSIVYYDGLGRELQSVAKEATPLGKDLVTLFEYDNFGRKSKDFLPVPTAQNNGLLVDAAVLSGLASSFYNGEPAFSEKVFEASPLNRVLMQSAPGTVWQKNSGHEIKFTDDVNLTSDEVKKYNVELTFTQDIYNPKLLFSSNYNAGNLIKKVTKDENWTPTSGNNNTSEEFINNEGKTILQRKYVDGKKADTYYVYDIYGNLTYVIPPLASDEVKSLATGLFPDVTLDNLCYQYKYDKKNRLVEKRVPGKGWEYMIYNKADQLVMSQDANLKAQGKWLVTKYDQFGRVAFTAITNNTGTRQSLQTTITGSAYTFEIRSANSFTVSAMPIYYTNRALPGSLAQVLSINYYDSYPAGYTFNPAFPTDILGEPTLNAIPSAEGLSTKSLPVLSLVKNIDDDSWSKDYTYYDKKGRVIGNHSINHLGGYTHIESKLDFAGVTKQTVTKHKRLDTDTERVITEMFEYDNQNRLLVQKHQVDSNPTEILAQNTYNEISQITNKKVGGTDLANPLQSVDFQYNVRGWLTKINDPSALNGKLFGYEVRYNNPVYTNLSSGRYNGNITEVDWRNASEGALKRYSYTYDPLNRLKDAIYSEPGATNPYNNNFNENLTYDLNGNIMTLKRNAYPVSGTTATQVDDLEYKYTGNRLNQVVENSPNPSGYEGGNNIIGYDLNGNMTDMKDKGIQSIVYNHMNLAASISMQFTNPVGNISTTNISHLYRADGVKLRKTYSQQAHMGLPTIRMTDYLDGFQYSYEDDGGICITCKTETAYEEQAYSTFKPVFPPSAAWKLDFVDTSEGFYSFAENRYIYSYKDHLGNVRVSFGKNNAGVVQTMDVNNYYPFGLNHIGGSNYSNFGSYYNYKFGGKEMQETGWHDFGARMYLSDLGRWGVVDPLAEVSRKWTPYHYAYNNPIHFIDPDGMLSVSSLQEMWDNTSGSSTWTNNGNGTFEGGEDDPKKKNARKAGSIPAGMTEEDALKEIITIDGKKYHKNTTNVGSVALNWLNGLAGGDDDYFVEHKEYNPVLDNELKTGAEVGSYFIGGVGGKAGTRILTEKLFVHNLKKIGFKELQVVVKGYSTEMNVFFKSGGKEMVSKKALQAYKELATRIINGTGGAPAGKATETALKVQVQRLEMINKALK
ncbi:MULTISPECIES: DUF6443 domain-containing protein [Chryseobacterium]|uniref:DUF6443 domain-containing protein n=1 Tax=Chryseobacterium TaxID=59732 RepID=UPI0039856062